MGWGVHVEGVEHAELALDMLGPRVHRVAHHGEFGAAVLVRLVDHQREVAQPVLDLRCS